VKTAEGTPESAVAELPNGARYFKCALHVNPFDYLARHGKAGAFADEATFNSAMVEALMGAGVQVVAVADHYRIGSSASLMDSASRAGLIVLPGFEAVAKDGVHLLCLFDPGTALARIDRVIGDCGVHDIDATSPQGDRYTEACLEEADDWACIMVAAHVCSKGD